MRKQSTTITIFFIASILIFQSISAQSSEDDMELGKYQRVARAPKPKFIRFGRAGAKFIRFGRSGGNTWEDMYNEPTPNEYYVKRGAKFIRFG